MHILALTDGGTGMQAQACGLAKQLATHSNAFAVFHQIVHTPSIVKLFPPKWARRSWHVFAPKELIGDTPNTNEDATSAPAIVIGCGAAAQSAVLALKRETGAFAVCIQRPRSNESAFDAIVAPTHDYVNDTPPSNTYTTLGAVGSIRPAMLSAKRSAAQQRFANIPAPRTALLIGGNNRAFTLTPDICKQLVHSILADNGGILATASRRTPADCIQALHEVLSDSHCYFYDGEGDNPYIDILAAADRIVVTGDSVNMISEACAAACPVYIADLPQTNAGNAKLSQKFNDFHAKLIARKHAHPWHGMEKRENKFSEWAESALDETAHAASFVWQKYQQNN